MDSQNSRDEGKDLHMQQQTCGHQLVWVGVRRLLPLVPCTCACAGPQLVPQCLLRLSSLHLCVPAPVPAVTVGVAQGPVSLGEECLVGETRVKDHA